MNHAGDHKTGNHEEDINTHITAWHRQSGMKRHDQQNCNRSKPLNVESPAVPHSPLNGLSFAFQIKNLPPPF